MEFITNEQLKQMDCYVSAGGGGKHEDAANSPKSGTHVDRNGIDRIINCKDLADYSFRMKMERIFTFQFLDQHLDERVTEVTGDANQQGTPRAVLIASGANYDLEHFI